MSSSDSEDIPSRRPEIELQCLALEDLLEQVLGLVCKEFMDLPELKWMKKKRFTLYGGVPREVTKLVTPHFMNHWFEINPIIDSGRQVFKAKIEELAKPIFEAIKSDLVAYLKNNKADINFRVMDDDFGYDHFRRDQVLKKEASKAADQNLFSKFETSRRNSDWCHVSLSVPSQNQTSQVGHGPGGANRRPVLQPDLMTWIVW